MKATPIVIFLVNVTCTFGSHELLHYVSDDVAGGSYKYYSLMYEGTITIALLSHKGDADLYVSETMSKPTYEPDNYCLQSTTCGGDHIAIPHTFKRPVTIGVYGHPSHDSSQYDLLVYRVALADDGVFDENLINSVQRKPLKTISRSSLILAFLSTLLDQFIQVLF